MISLVACSPTLLYAISNYSGREDALLTLANLLRNPPPGTSVLVPLKIIIVLKCFEL